MSALTIEPVPCLKDNYAYLVYDRDSGFCGVVDPSEAGPVLAALEARNLKLTHILNTQHHNDHVGGNLELKAKTGARVTGAGKDRERFPGLDDGAVEGDVLQFGAHEAHVLEIPAHTSSHLAYYFPRARAVFTGDTMFAMGCGRLFEGTPAMMWASLTKLSDLPEDTNVYCGHEYTEANGRFALTLEPNNLALQARMKDVRALRSEGKPTVPSTIAQERETNPFLRAGSAEIRRTLGLEQAGVIDVFAETRKRKDSF